MTIQIKGQKIKTYDEVALQPVKHMRSIGLCRRLVVGGRWYEDASLEDGMRAASLKDGMRTVSLEDGMRTASLEDGMRTVSLEDGMRTASLEDGMRTVSLEGPRASKTNYC